MFKMNRSNQSFRGNLTDRNPMGSRTNYSPDLGRGLLMPHSSSSTQTSEFEQTEGPIASGSSLNQLGRRSVEGVRGPLGSLAQLERRTVESSRLIRDNLHNVFEEFVQSRSNPNSRLTLSNWLHNRPSFASQSSSSDSYVIDLEGNFDNAGAGREPNNGQNVENITPQSSPTTASSTNVLVNEGNNNSNPSPPEESAADAFPLNPEINSIVTVIKKYLPFVTIILSKAIYDHIPAILLFLGLYGTFGFYNSRLKSEIALHAKRNTIFLLFAIGHLIVTITCFYYLYDDMKLYLSLVFIPPYIQPLSVTDLLWLVAVTDFILKLITIIVKTCITLIPHSIFEAKKRGKWYLAVETTSQLYRSLVPIQPWLYYLLESYQGPQKVVGVFLSAAYMVSKGADLMSRARTWWSSMLKLLQNVQLGISPDKEQLSTAGLTCPICHDDYDSPVLLTCRHVFCEGCVARWFDREQTCPLCRAKVVDDPSWRDGATTYFAQLF